MCVPPASNIQGPPTGQELGIAMSTEDKNAREDVPQDGAEATQKRELTARERAALERLEAADPPLRLKLTDEEYQRAIADHPDEEVGFALIMQALGVTNAEFTRSLLADLVSASTWAGELREDRLNALFAGLISMKPQDERQAMLGLQTVLTHQLTLSMNHNVAHAPFFSRSLPDERHLVHSEKMLAWSTTVRAFTKLAHTYMEQMRTLDDLQRPSDEGVTIQVRDGGQAFVANMPQSQRRAASEMPTPPALSRSQAVPMPMLERPAASVVPLEGKARRRNGKVRR